jgi:hypothetical protein
MNSRDARSHVEDIVTELGVEHHCPRCHELWPADDEFWLPRIRTCRACQADRIAEGMRRAKGIAQSGGSEGAAGSGRSPPDDTCRAGEGGSEVQDPAQPWRPGWARRNADKL